MKSKVVEEEKSNKFAVVNFCLRYNFNFLWVGQYLFVFECFFNESNKGLSLRPKVEVNQPVIFFIDWDCTVQHKKYLPNFNISNGFHVPISNTSNLLL